MAINANVPVPTTIPDDTSDNDSEAPIWRIVEKYGWPENIDVLNKLLDFAKVEKSQRDAKSIGMVLASFVNITVIVLILIDFFRG